MAGLSLFIFVCLTQEREGIEDTFNALIGCSRGKLRHILTEATVGKCNFGKAQAHGLLYTEISRGYGTAFAGKADLAKGDYVVGNHDILQT